MYYAVSTAHDLNFVLRGKGEDLSTVGGNVSAESSGLAHAQSSASVASAASATPSASASASASRQQRGPRDASRARRRLLGIAI